MSMFVHEVPRRREHVVPLPAAEQHRLGALGQRADESTTPQTAQAGSGRRRLVGIASGLSVALRPA